MNGGGEQRKTGNRSLRFRIDFVEESTAIVFVENACEAPRLVLEWLYVLDFDDEDVSWFGVFNFERAGQVVNLGQVDVLHVICTVIVANLSSCPINTFNLNDFSILDFGSEWDCGRSQWQSRELWQVRFTVRMPSVLQIVSR